MPKPLRNAILPLLLVSVLTLAACKSDEEKAADYFRSGQELLASGDEDRALVEFRNVFKYDPFHFEARKTYADVQLRRGKIEEAYSQYLRLIEQYPDTAEARLILAELAFAVGNWEEVERHGVEALRLSPDEPRAKVIGLALDYQRATTAKDDAARATAAEAAAKALKEQPDNDIARRIAVDHLMSGPQPMQAMPLIEAALAVDPAVLDYHMMKFLLLTGSGDVAKTGEQLKTMFGLFPENEQVRSALIQWYLLNEDFEGAEAFLRKVASDPVGPVELHLALLQFLQERKGNQAVRGELEALIASNGQGENGQLYSAMLAAIDFEEGKKEEAIAALRAIVAKAEPGSRQTNLIRGILARSLDQKGDRAGAAAMVEEILASDHTNAAALKLRARWALEADQVVPAIQDLNAALTSAPRDPQIFELLAQAQQRDGNPKAMGEYLVQAFEYSGRAPEPAMNLARYQASQGEVRQARETLAQAWMANPGSEQIMRMLTDLLISQGDWATADSVLKELKLIDARGIGAAEAILLDAQGRSEEALELLRQLVGRGEQVAVNAQTAVRILVRKGDGAAALAFVESALAVQPQDRGLRLVLADLKAQAGDTEAVIAIYRALIKEDPADDLPVRRLHAALTNGGQAQEARAVLAAGLAASPANHDLLRMRAMELEADGKFEEAIAMYERLYTDDSSDVLVANNLASLLANNRKDAESLDRAEAVSRRLRGLNNPALQDTFGWIAFLTGNTYGALAHLEPAAKGLPEDALTQYHLGKLYQSMARPAEAIAQYDKAIALAEQSPILADHDQIKDARSQRDKLKAEAPTP